MNILNGLAISLGLLQSKCIIKNHIIACYVTGCRKNIYQIMRSSGRKWANYVTFVEISAANKTDSNKAFPIYQTAIKGKAL